MLYASKKLKNEKRYLEHKALCDFYFKQSIAKEASQQRYLMTHLFFNKNTGEKININTNFDNYYKKYTKSVEQKAYAIEEEARDKKLVPIFITLTLPAKNGNI